MLLVWAAPYVLSVCMRHYAVQDTKGFHSEKTTVSYATIECEQPQPDLYK